jgi:hypothetical protein
MNRNSLIIFLLAANLVIFALLVWTVVRGEREIAEARAARETAGFYANPPTLP